MDGAVIRDRRRRFADTFDAVDGRRPPVAFKPPRRPDRAAAPGDRS